MTKKIKKIIFPVGGLGTRFLPATKSLPKEMLPVFNKPIIQYAFEEAVDAGIEEFIFITGRNKNAITNHFDHVYELQKVLGDKAKVTELELTKGWLPKAGQTAFIRQQEPLGLGHAIWCARNFVKDEPFAVILADELLKPEQDGAFMKKMIQAYNGISISQDRKTNIMGIYEVPKHETYKYGIIDYSNKNDKILINRMVEKPKVEDAPSNYALVGRYILQPEIFAILENQEKGNGGEIQLTDAMDHLRQTQDFYGCNFTGERFDCGNPLGYLDANISFGYDANKEAVTKLLNKYNG